MDSAQTVLHDVTVVDPQRRRATTNQSILIAEGRILDIVAASNVDTDGDLEVISGGGHYAIPGLIDAHIHLRDVPHKGPSDESPTPSLATKNAGLERLDGYLQRLHTFLYCGVTSIYDAGNDSGTIFSLRESERSGLFKAPRIHCTGNLLTVQGGHGCTAGVEIGEGDDIAAVVKDHISLNPDVVKVTYDEHNWGVRPLVPLLSKVDLARIISEVHAYGRKVTVHVSNETRAREAVECGADILAHPVIQSPMTPEFAKELADRGIPVVTTLAIGDRYFRLADQPEYLDLPLYEACETAAERKRLQTEESSFQQKNRWADWMRVMTPIAQENIKLMVDAGCVIATGTDQSFGPDYHRELELLAAAGLSSWEILAAATSGAAAAIDQQARLGTFAAGACADIVLLRQDPIAGVENWSSIEGVIKGGHLIDRHTLQVPANVMALSK